MRSCDRKEYSHLLSLLLQGLYSQEYSCLGVLCASLPAWQSTSSGPSSSGIHDDIRFLNDIIIQFDDVSADRLQPARS